MIYLVKGFMGGVFPWKEAVHALSEAEALLKAEAYGIFEPVIDRFWQLS